MPTIGPLFGSYKVQLDVFEIPIRLYNAKLHNNKLGVGMDMRSIYLPQIKFDVKHDTAQAQTFADNEQVNASCILKYIGIAGAGAVTGTMQSDKTATRLFNAVPFLAYWDIYKNYYANKQEEIGFVIHTASTSYDTAQKPTAALVKDSLGAYKGNALS